MCRKSVSRISYVLLVSMMSLFVSGCANDILTQEPGDAMPTGVAVLWTDSDEWRVEVFAERLVYSEAVQVVMPEPWVLPTQEEAKVLHDLTFGSGQYRYVTSDGYTFGMPSASVTKAGSKTHYSVLGLWRRRTVYDIEF